MSIQRVRSKPLYGKPVYHPAPEYPIGENKWLEFDTFSPNGGATLRGRYLDDVSFENHELRRLYEILKERFA